jgi:hypothetical protein
MRHALLLLFCTSCWVSTAQDIESTSENVAARLREDPVRFSGGLAIGGQYADISGAPARYDDFDWSLQANLNVDILGFQLPFSAFISDRNRLYNLPSYQFVGLSPTYRWARLHLGDRSMNFNPYTFSNQQFRGIGAELMPGKWRLAGFYGRLNRLQVGDFNARQDLEIRYRRMGFATEIGYQTEAFALKGTVFRARDEEQEGRGEPIRGLAPAENWVASLEASSRIGKRLTLSGTLAQSWLTEDRTAAVLPDSIADFLVGGNASTSRESAVRATAAYALEKSNWQLNYERLSPNYRSLGTLYITPDRENVTAGTAFQLADNKVTLSLNGGLQRNNLGGDKLSTQRRIIAQVSTRAAITDRLSANLNLSNFNNTSRLRSFFDPLSSTDSIFLAQVNRSGRIGLRLTRPENRAPGVATLNFSVQDAQSIQDEELTTFRNTIYNTYLGYGGQQRDWKLNYRAQILYGVTVADIADNTLISPSLSLTRPFGDEQLILGLTSSYSFVDYEDRGTGRVLLSRLTATYQLSESGSLRGRYQFTRRRLGDAPVLAESLIALNYAWTFQ